MPYINWTGKAAEAQARGDWAEAKRCYYYAAQACQDGDMRAYYNDCEDACGEHLRAVLKMQAEYDAKCKQ